MCCCIPLRTLCYFGAIIHMGIGIYFLYLLGAVSYALYAPSREMSEFFRYMGFMYIAYYAVFLPPGIFIFWGVYKKQRHFLVWPPFSFLLIQLFSVGLQMTSGYIAQSLPTAIKDSQIAITDEPKKLNVDFWMNVFVQLTITLAYLFLLFFYHREIGPESAPVHSRYAQYPYIAQTLAAVTAHQQQQQQQAAALALHMPQPQQGTSGQPPPSQPAPPPPLNQTPQPQHLSHLAIGSNQAVAYHPVNVVSVGSPPPTSIPIAISPATSGPLGPIPGLPSRTSSSNTVPQGGINLGTLASLSYEQQQQILKFHQQQIMHQQQHHQHQQHQQQQLQHHQLQQHQQQLGHSSAIEHEIQQQILQQFPAYAALLGANQPGKSPKY